MVVDSFPSWFTFVHPKGSSCDLGGAPVQVCFEFIRFVPQSPGCTVPCVDCGNWGREFPFTCCYHKGHDGEHICGPCSEGDFPFQSVEQK